MRVIPVVGGLLVAAGAVVFHAQAGHAEETAPSAKPLKNAPAALSKGVAELESQVARLQAEKARIVEAYKELKEHEVQLAKKVSDLERRLAVRPVRVLPSEPIRVGPGANAVGPGAVERQFNGITYYVVPLSGRN